MNATFTGIGHGQHPVASIHSAFVQRSRRLWRSWLQWMTEPIDFPGMTFDRAVSRPRVEDRENVCR
jgi:hypothetical protein